MCAALVSQMLLAGSRAEGLPETGATVTLESQERVKRACPDGAGGTEKSLGTRPRGSSDSLTEHLPWPLAGPRGATKPVLVPSDPGEELNLTLQE